jgi:hypothetical protein
MSEPSARWQRLADAILATPGALAEETRRTIASGDDPHELAPLLDKVRRHAYRIVDEDVDGIDVDILLEAVLAAAFDVADSQLRSGLRAIGCE